MFNAVEKKHTIIREATYLCRTRKISEITVEMVCRKADVGKGTFYKYYSDKEDLVRTVIDRQQKLCWNCLMDYLYSIRSLDFKTRLDKSVDYLMIYVRNDPGFRNVMADHVFLPVTWEEFRAAEDKKCAALMEDLTAYAGEKNLDPRDLFTLIMNVHNNAVILARQAAESKDDSYRAAMTASKYLKNFIEDQL